MTLSLLKKGRLNSEVYQMGLENFPIPTLDFVVKRPDGKILLIKRNEGAFNKSWFLVGGRQMRGETMQEGLLRIAEREVGLLEADIFAIKFSHCQDVYNPASENAEGSLPAWHSVWHFHVIDCVQGFKPIIDSTSSEAQWYSINSLPLIPGEVNRAIQEARNRGYL